MNTDGPWGFHALLDCRSGNKAKITDRDNIIAFVKDLVKRIDMKAFGEPVVEHFATHDPEKAGYSMFQLIETSNISAHYVDKNGNFYVDVFSCKPFDNEEVVKVIQEYFDPENVTLNYIERNA